MGVIRDVGEGALGIVFMVLGFVFYLAVWGMFIIAALFLGSTLLHLVGIL